MTPFDAYQMYLAIKQHFTTSYDYFKYNGKTKASPSAFEGRKDRHHFVKLAKKNKEAEAYIVANVFANPDFWIGDINSDEASKAFAEMQRRQQSLSYLFSEEIGKIDNLKEWLRVVEPFPKLFMEYRRKNISPETLIIMDDCINILTYWEKHIDDVLFFQPEINKLRKYKPFFKYDKHKYKNILREKFR